MTSHTASRFSNSKSPAMHATGVWQQMGVAPDSIAPLLAEAYRTPCCGRVRFPAVCSKQALPQLRVEAEWLCDRRRILGESAAMRALAPLLPPGSIPAVLCEDAGNCAFAMSAVPPPLKPGNPGSCGTIASLLHRLKSRRRPGSTNPRHPWFSLRLSVPLRRYRDLRPAPARRLLPLCRGSPSRTSPATSRL